MVKTSLFVTFEGGEGAGKTTLMDRLQSTLKSKGFDVLRTREPGGTSLGDKIREILLNPDPLLTIGPKAELFLFLAQRAQHIEQVIQPALSQGKIVLCDRFTDSSVVYQGKARHLGMDFVQQLSATALGDISPELTFFLDVDPSVGLTRTRDTDKENALKGDQDRIEGEGLSFHQLVREGFHHIAKDNPNRCTIIDAMQSKEQVFEQVYPLILKVLEKKHD